MRVTQSSQGLTVQAIAGTYVVLLAMNMKEADCAGHMGFAIHRTDHTEGEAYWMEGMKTFEATDPGFVAGSKYPTNKHPIQGFTWSDFTAKPGHKYTYRVEALQGDPTALKKFKSVELAIETESEAGGDHDVFFNRGAAASQEYARRFGKNSKLDGAPDDDPRWAWLSRGANEAIHNFLARAKDAGYGIRVAAYEFRLEPFAEALKAAKDRGADVKILYDACDNPPDENGIVFPRDANHETAANAHIKSLCKGRVTRTDVKKPPIAHNKFIVLLKDGKPVAVLTGSTNFSQGGVFGQSNVVHVVENDSVAGKYLKCWDLISKNPDHDLLRQSLAELNQLPTDLPKKGTSCIFSPQPSFDALEWYAKLAREAQGGLFMTFPFGMAKQFKVAFKTGAAPLRYALMDQLLSSGIKKEKRDAAIAEMVDIRKQVENRIAVGNKISTNAFDRWLSEKLTGLNSHVRFIHTKFMLINPLSDDPIVVTGSANFSEASTDSNDENMLVIRGDVRVADIYLGEYMRLWNHYAFREWVAAGAPGGSPEFKHLDIQDTWWKKYFGDTAQSRQRVYFSGVA
jgi:phosphatidylserine/phosphatidylglycerophosphate/cardiolipin synthase-like enzyme